MCIKFQVFKLNILPLWLPNCSASSLQRINATFTKFLKRYLQIPSHSSNATVHFITSTVPLSKTLHKASPNAIASLSFPPILYGHCLSFFPKPVEEEPSKDFIEIVKDIPTSFWLSWMPLTIPSNCKARKRLVRVIFDSFHFRI